MTRAERPLRSNFQPGTSRWAVRRAQWRALGLSEEEMARPKIAIVNSSSDIAICFAHLDRIAAAVKKEIRAAGGLPFEIRTTAPSDFILSAGRRATYILPSRDLIANDIEVQVEGPQLDGMLLLASCDKTLPGQLMAAARLDIPAIAVICGYQASGRMPDGSHVDIEEVFLHAGHVAQGAMSPERLTEMTEHAIRSPGVCSGMGTANSMHSAAEALGMTLPGAAPVAALSAAMWDQARAAARRIVAMVHEDLRPRRILTPAAFRNAAAVVLAQAGSINCIKHLQAIALEAGVDIDLWRLFAELGPRVPVLTAVRPIGELSIEAFEAAGGARAVMAELGDLIDGGALTVTGRTVAETLAGHRSADPAVIRPRDNPFATTPAIVILRGSLAPVAAVAKVGLPRPGRPRRHRGPAIVFDDPAAAEAALSAGRIGPGAVVVLRGQGVRGGPGMGGASRLVFALDGAGLGAEVAVVTDGQLSGLVNKGLVIGEVQPEAAEGGPLALVHDGDVIAIDIDSGRLDLEVSPETLAGRARGFAPPPPVTDSGWLSIYERCVTPLSAGASLIDRARSR